MNDQEIILKLRQIFWKLQQKDKDVISSDLLAKAFEVFSEIIEILE